MLEGLFRETEDKMDKGVEATEREFQSLRTGRASTDLLNGVTAHAYGADTPLNQLATISTPDAATILIQPWDVGQLPAVEKAIHAANLGMTPNNDGKVIRLNIPQMTEEKRKEIVKKAHDIAEHGRIAIRNIRRHSNDEIKKTEKNHEISEDERKRYLDKVQAKTDVHIKKIDELLAKKEQEVMHV
jgi:ribosome recycling factor